VNKVAITGEPKGVVAENDELAKGGAIVPLPDVVVRKALT
jgi:hypothetical protein